MKTEATHRVVRDPIHRLIAITDAEWEVLRSPEMQRLRCIKQLANLHLVYPGAVHTRFGHSLGTMHVAGLIAKQLGCDSQSTAIVRRAALLHDVGHAPFSHVGENLLMDRQGGSVSHAAVSSLIIEDSPDLGRALEGHFRKRERERIASLLRRVQARPSLLKDIIDGPLDADKLDYLPRDSYFCGISYGLFDVDWFIESLTELQHPITTPDGTVHVGLPKRRILNAEEYRLARSIMHAYCYQHHTRIAADSMLLRAARNAMKMDDEAADRLRKGFTVTPTHRFLRDYLSLNDYTFMDVLASSSSKLCQAFARRVLGRDLVKRAAWVFPDEAGHAPAVTAFNALEEKGAQAAAVEKQIATAAGCPASQVFVYVASLTNKLYKAPGWIGAPEGELI